MEAAATELASTLSSSTLLGMPYAAAAAASPLVQQQLRRLHELHQQLQQLRPFPHLQDLKQDEINLQRVLLRQQIHLQLVLCQDEEQQQL